jgi:hypothetical protein
MNKLKRLKQGIIVLFLVLLSAININADEIKYIGRNDVLPKSQFMVAKEIINEGVVQGDLFIGAKVIASSGVIEGDFIAGGNNISASGIIGGDILCGGESIDIDGTVKGNIRSAGTNISISGLVSKNANLFGQSIKIKSDGIIERNLLTFGEYIRVDGKVKGYTKIGGNRIVLNGEFFGDVDINTESFWSKGPGSITILPGTIIHGKLTYQATEVVAIPDGADVGNVNWIESESIEKNAEAKSNFSIGKLFSSFIKLLLATSVYFLIAMLFLKLFPGIFKNLSQSIQNNLLRTTVAGLLGILSVILVLIGFIVIIVFSILFKAPSLIGFAGMISIGFYYALFYLAFMPVSLWIGNLLFKDKYTLPIRFGLGLGIISVLQFVLKLFGNIPTIGPLFEFLSFVLCIGILLIGIGALLNMTKKVIVSVRNYDPIQK